MKKLFIRIVTVMTIVIVLLVAAVIGYFIYFQRKIENPAITHTPPPPVAYGIRLDSLQVTYGSVAINQNLSGLLSSYVDAAVIDLIAKRSNEVFDVRKIKSGNRYGRIFTKDSTHKTCYFIYEINPIDFVVFDLRDSLRIYKDKKKVTRQIKTAAGTIQSSLWNTFIDNKLDVNLGLALSDVYAWTVDFYGLQKGDNFKVIYEELFVDNHMVGIDKILAARFQTNSHDYYAYYFEQQNKGAYFDEKGESLQRSFLKAPLKFSRISSRFSRSRMHPILRIARPHFGVDYSAPKGTPVVALGDGSVKEAGYHGGYGRFISIRHNSVYTTTYAHLSGYAKGLKPGKHVQQGEVIGYVGSSGLSTGPHLDFRVYRNGTPTDPLKMESPPSKPVDPRDVEKYKQLVARMNAELAK